MQQDIESQQDIELGSTASDSKAVIETQDKTVSEQKKTFDDGTQDDAKSTEGITDPLLKKVLKEKNSSPTESRKLLDDTMVAFSGEKVPNDQESQENEKFIKKSDVEQVSD